MAAAGWAPGLDVTLEFRRIGGTWVDISAYLRAFDVGVSRSRVLSLFPPGSGSFALDNRDGRFCTWNSGSPYSADLLPGRHIRLKATYNAVTYNVWYGVVDDWGDSFPDFRDHLAVVTCSQPSQRLADARTSDSTPVGANELTGARVSRALTSAGWTLSTALDAGLVTLQPADMTRDAASIVTDAVRAEGGAAWCEGDGTFRFEGRHALILNSRSAVNQVTFGPDAGETPYHSPPEISSGVDLVVTQATRGNSNGSPVTRTNAGLETLLAGRYADSITDLQSVDAHNNAGLADAALILGYGPIAHPRQISLKPAGSPTLCWPQALGRRIRDRVQVHLKTPQFSGNYFVDCWIAGISHSAVAGEWVTTFDLEPATTSTLDAFGVYGPSAYGTGKYAW